MEEELTFFMRPSERQFFDLLNRFSQSKECPTQSDIRVAGGWVRDGLLRMPSNDLDVALADCTGNAFAQAFQKWLLRYTDMGQVHVVVVRANPDKSKHLETAIMEFPAFGLSVDFVNLRSETYADSSRIPDSKFGTAIEDAYRRDFTINALFYNVTTNEIEDHTGQGKTDLDHMILRTPLPPSQTFMDDPLRLIRAARFLAKFPQLKPCAELREAACLPKVKRALEIKVTRDRTRQELVKIFEYPQPVRALTFLVECGLMHSLLTLDEPFREAWRYETRSIKTPYNQHIDELEAHWNVSVVYLDGADRVLRQITKADLPSTCIFWHKDIWNKSDIRGAFKFAALLARHHAIRVPDGSGFRTAAEEALLNLKCKGVALEVAKLQELACAIMHLNRQRPVLNEWAATFRLPGASRWWVLAALLVAVIEVCSENLTRQGDVTRQADVKAIMKKFHEIKKVALDEFKLESVSELAPLFNGKEIKRFLPYLTGPQIGEVITEQIRWLLEHWEPDAHKRMLQANELQQHLVKLFSLV